MNETTKNENGRPPGAAPTKMSAEITPIIYNRNYADQEYKLSHISHFREAPCRKRDSTRYCVGCGATVYSREDYILTEGDGEVLCRDCALASGEWY